MKTLLSRNFFSAKYEVIVNFCNFHTVLWLVEEFILLPIIQDSLIVIKFEDVFGTYFYWEFNNSQCTLHSSKWTFRQNWLSSLYCCLKVAQHSVEIQNNVCHSDFTWNKCYLKWMLCRGSAFDSGEFNFQTSISRNFWVVENFWISTC